ncbi:MAG: hypothetical protein ACR2Q3_15995 [Woeseiaceae bacterium]
MSRFRASFIHLSISAVLVAAVLSVVYLVWYPEPLLDVAGAFPVVRLLVLVHLVIGPLLTLVVYVQGKAGLRFDLTVIGLLQIAALCYGSYRLYVEKPDYLVFAIDRVELISSKQVDELAIQFEEPGTEQFAKLTQVFARPPENPKEHQRYLESLMTGQPDLERRAEFWEPWAAGAETIRNRVKAINKIEPTSSRESENIRQAVAEYGDLHPNLGVLPIGGIQRDLGMLIDRDTLEVLDMLDANPWPSDAP